MRRIALVLSLIGTSPLAAQEFGIHVSSAAPRQVNQALSHGVGVALGGSFRIGDILADSTLARKTDLRVGGRVSFTRMAYGSTGFFSSCADVCIGVNRPVTLHSWLFTAFVLPYATRSTRMELNGGIGRYDYRASDSYSNWGFVAGASAMWRIGPTPLWFQLGYTRHGDTVAQIADGGAGEPPVHSARAGLTYRFADRRSR